MKERPLTVGHTGEARHERSVINDEVRFAVMHGVRNRKQKFSRFWIRRRMRYCPAGGAAHLLNQ